MPILQFIPSESHVLYMVAIPEYLLLFFLSQDSSSTPCTKCALKMLTYYIALGL